MRNYPINEIEKLFKKLAYEKGMENGWCSGRYAEEDGDFIVEEDRLNLDSFVFIEDIFELEEFFRRDAWCLGQAVIFEELCFIQQVDGGDEWLTMKLFGNEVIAFDSISFQPSIRHGKLGELLGRLLEASREQCKLLTY